MQIKWKETSDKDKIRLIITNVLGWPCYESSSEYHKRADHRDGSSVAFWEYQPYGHSHWSVYYKPFNPLRSMDDAWFVVERIAEPPRMPEEALKQAHTQFMLWWQGSDIWAMKRADAAQSICINALRSCGVEVIE